MQEQLTDLIVQRINEESVQLKQQFFNKHPFKVARHFALDKLLPQELAEKIYAEFAPLKQMRTLNSSGECKLKFMQLKNTSPLLQDLTFAIQDPKVVAAIEQITEIKDQQPDPKPAAGGVTMMPKGGFINPHLDNSHDVAKNLYRTVNLLYYVSPDWKEENGGNFELWDELVERAIVVPSLFNRLVVMETTPTSWHAVNPVRCESPRSCVFNYFFSEKSPKQHEYFHMTSFNARPEQKIRRVIVSAKRAIFNSVGKLFRNPD